VWDIIAGRTLSCHESCENFDGLELVTISEHELARALPVDTRILEFAGSIGPKRMPDSGLDHLFGFRNKLIQKSPTLPLQAPDFRFERSLV
jgi:hypothetical protein